MDKKFPIQIEHCTDKKCYVCGRTPEQVGSIFDVGILKKLMTQAITKRNQQIQDLINQYLDQLKQLSKEVQDYQGNLTLSELSHNYRLSAKIAPKYQELAKFAPKAKNNDPYGYNRQPDYTIDDLREYLNQLIQEIEQGNFSNLEDFNQDLAQRVQMLVTPNIDGFKTNDTRFSVFNMVKGFDLTGKDIITETYDDGDFIFKSYYYKDEIEAIKAQRNDFGLLKKKAKTPIDPNNVILVNLTYYLCPICSNMFFDASKASYREIHRNDD
jgi:hypothetical protein